MSPGYKFAIGLAVGVFTAQVLLLVWLGIVEWVDSYRKRRRTAYDKHLDEIADEVYNDAMRKLARSADAEARARAWERAGQ